MAERGAENRRREVLQAVLLAATVYAFFSGLIGLGSVIARFSRELGLGREETGLMFSTASLVSAAIRVPVGVLADIFGSKTLMALGLGAGFAASLLALHSSSMEDLLLVRGVQGLAIALFIAPSIAVTSMIGGSWATALAVSARSTAISLAMITAPFIANFLVDTLGYEYAFTYSAVIALTGFAPLVFLKPRRPRRGREPRIDLVVKSLRNPVILSVIAIALLDGSVFISLQVVAQYEVAEKGLPATYYGVFASLYGLAGLFSRSTSTKLLTSLGAARTMTLGLLMEVAGLLLLVFFRENTLLFYAAAILLGSGLGYVVTGEQYTLVTSTQASVRNTLASIYAMGVDVGGGLGSIAYTRAAGAQGYTAAYALMLGVELTALLIALTILNKRIESSRR